MFSTIDYRLRDIFSYVFRFILIVYCSIVLFSYETYFYYPVYIISIILYIILFNYFKNRKLSKLRTFLDFLFIVIMIYNPNQISQFAYFTLLMPLINSQNNSAKKNNFYGYLYAVVSVLILQLYSVFYFLPIFFIFFIDLFLRFRNKIRNVSETLFEIVDEFYGSRIAKEDNISIYEKIIEKIQALYPSKTLKINVILCFSIRKAETLVLVNGSKKVIQFNIADEQTLINELYNKQEASGYRLTIDSDEYTTTVFYFIKGKSRKYCFCIVYSEHNNFTDIFRKFLVNDLILVPAFKHLARLYEIQNNITVLKNKNLVKLSENQEYVLKANEVMHFVKNSMSPIKNALTLSELYDISENEDEKKFLKEKFIYQRRLAKIEIENIIKRSNFILEKSKNPFEADQFEVMNAYQIFDYIRKSWIEKIQGEIKISGTNVSKILSSNINSNLNVIDLILINIFSNITKYSIGENVLEFIINDNSFTISFLNKSNFKKLEDFKELQKLIEYYNRNNRIEIAKRKSHGFVHLRTYCDALEIKSMISLTAEHFFSFQIKFDYYENSDI